MSQRRIIQFIAAVIAVPIALVLLWFVYSRYVIWRYDGPFHRVAHGDTDQHVIALLGKPHRITREHQTQLAWVTDRHEDYSAGDCVFQFRYIPWSPTGDQYVIGFDSGKRAVSKYEITSP